MRADVPSLIEVPGEGRILRRGHLVARFARDEADVIAAQRLRHLCFVERAGGQPRPDGRDADAFDALCRHVLVEDDRAGRLVCCFRLLPLAGGAEIGRSYAAQHYDLAALRDYPGPIMEVGRFCVHPEIRDGDVLRVAWGALTRIVDANGVQLLFGCSSFAGTEAAVYLDAFGMLAEGHLAPGCWLPRVKAPRVVRFAAERLRRPVDRGAALRRMPPLLRTYLSMGGWVSDHAVVDEELNTLHVFTGLEIRGVPPARARALRAVAG